MTLKQGQNDNFFQKILHFPIQYIKMNGKMPREGVIFGLLAVWTTLVHHIWFTLIPTLNFLITSRLLDILAKKVSRNLQEVATPIL